MKKNKVLTELPIWENGRYKGKINWNKTIGMQLDLLYNGDIYNVTVIDYKNSTLWVDYNGYIYDKGISLAGFKNGNFGSVLKLITREFKYEIGDVIDVNTGDSKTIIGLEHRNNKVNSKGDTVLKYYNYKCSKCNYEGWILESNLSKGVGCPCCSTFKKTAVLGINTIWDTDRWMCDLGVSEKDAKRYTRGSGKKVEVTCPDCGSKKSMLIVTIYKTKTISCTCNDNTSYPERLMTNILKQLNMIFKTQLSISTFKWCGDKLYDFYIPSLDMIIETHGRQHYEESGFRRTLEEERANDKFKKQLALDNGIKHYIVLDCRYSDMEHIKDSILSSKLKELIDLSKVDFVQADLIAIKSNKVREACNYWNDKYSVVDIANIVSVSDVTVRSYLKRGARLGWCNYDSKEEFKKSKARRCKPVGIFKNGQSLGIFESCAELARKSEELFGVKLSNTKISEVAIGKGKCKTHKGYIFKYIENDKIAN